MIVVGREGHVQRVFIAACEPVWGSSNVCRIKSRREFEEKRKRLESAVIDSFCRGAHSCVRQSADNRCGGLRLSSRKGVTKT